MTPRSPAGIVLVHGGFHGPWSWDKVVARLGAANVAVATPDLYATPGNPADPGVVQAAVDRLATNGPVIVCGHSFGGCPISALDPATVAHLVYIAAMLPDREVWYAASAAHEHTATMSSTVDGVTTVEPAHARELYYADCDEADALEAMRRLRPHPGGEPSSTVERPAWREVPTTYVCCERDNALKPAYQAAAAARVGNRVSWPTGHSPMIARPDIVVDLLRSLARRVAA